MREMILSGAVVSPVAMANRLLANRSVQEPVVSIESAAGLAR